MDINDILAERQHTHGNFDTNAAFVQMLKQICHTEKTWSCLSSSQKEAIENICQKLGRIITGNPNHIDSWDDIAGYATLGARSCKDV